jgi:hypothetical protein
MIWGRKTSNVFELNGRGNVGFLLILFFSLQKLSAQNILISSDHFPNEPSIMMDPKRPDVLIAAANLNNYYVSTDTGFTWSQQTLSSTYGVWGDPCIAVDTADVFYFFHLSNPADGNWIDRIVCQKTMDDGQSWNDGTYTGLNDSKAQDKEWCAIDRANNHIYLTWTQFDDYGSTDPMDSSIILFSSSPDQGESWSNPVRISHIAGDCIDSDNTVEGAVPAVGPNGEIYVAWAGPAGLVFNRSSDQGITWLNQEIIVDSIPGGWDYNISGIYRSNGLPVTACDLSDGPYRGTVYINWSDQRHGETNTDVFLSKSNNGGNTWSSPVKVNDDESNRQQFLTWMTIDQTTGFLYIVFYDRRNYPDDSTDVFLAVSMDGGNTFINRRISESPFFPTSQVFFGDYNNIVAHDGIIRPVWTRLNNGSLSIWTDITSLDDILTGIQQPAAPTAHLDFEYFPNPSAHMTYVSFKLHSTALINLTLHDLSGHIVKRIIDARNMGYGKYVEKINLDELNVAEGVYVLNLDIDHQSTLSRMIVITKP